eukprot:gnl/MRDRNA2_/MRDRNA2_350126_c0_seq1.p1 gnl/MRDRNA2_/MRDRNA2_350126_c0~~gnl/MRDRNA2_/MRDRNA2_350126_c0_seq1.p1  ORF type:complete len:114 (+),score=7.41 gnl/MRDRNA2_/MRDRNA2_350126_c0_seq1:321-662(+)
METSDGMPNATCTSNAIFQSQQQVHILGRLHAFMGIVQLCTMHFLHCPLRPLPSICNRFSICAGFVPSFSIRGLNTSNAHLRFPSLFVCLKGLCLPSILETVDPVSARDAEFS